MLLRDRIVACTVVPKSFIYVTPLPPKLLRPYSIFFGHVEAKFNIVRIGISWRFFVKRREKYQSLLEYIIQISEISI